MAANFHKTSNPIYRTDSYKVTHWPQYPPGTEKVYSYFESRGGKWQSTVFFGLQYILKQYLVGEQVTFANVLGAEQFYERHLGNKRLFNRAGWEHIVRDHNGRFPLSIRAVAEGSVVPIHNVLMTVENTCPKCYWLTNFWETTLVQTWYPTTVATQSREIKKIILKYLQDTGTPEEIAFKLHDFGGRGVSSCESAEIGGAAHLINFMGSDTVLGIICARDYYSEECAGFSIPASEHSTITSWGREHEGAAFANMLRQYPTGPVACVSDSWDIFNACSQLWGMELREEVLNRKGLLVVRPDSGDPPTTVLKVVQRLATAFGSTVNGKGYRVLHPNVRVIQGDGVNIDTIPEVLRVLREQGFSADNVAFGMGGALLQRLDRDTQRFAFKCSYVSGTRAVEQGAVDVTREPWHRDVYKQPVTDPGKDSKRGRLSLVNRGGKFFTQAQSLTKPEEDCLVEVFRDGELLVDTTFDAVRKRAAL